MIDPDYDTWRLDWQLRRFYHPNRHCYVTALVAEPRPGGVPRPTAHIEHRECHVTGHTEQAKTTTQEVLCQLADRYLVCRVRRRPSGRTGGVPPVEWALAGA